MLKRFLDAQQYEYAQALQEIRGGPLILLLGKTALLLRVGGTFRLRLLVFPKHCQRRPVLGNGGGELVLLRQHGGERPVLLVHAGGILFLLPQELGKLALQIGFCRLDIPNALLVLAHLAPQRF